MAREYTKVKQFEELVFQRKNEGATNAEIALELGLSKAQIKGLVKRYNKRQLPELINDDSSDVRSTLEVNEELTRLSQEVNELETTLQQINRMFSQLAQKNKPLE